MGKRDEGHRTAFGRDQDYRTIEHRPSGAHPGTEHGPVGGCLMMRMVPGVFDGLRLRESADGQDTEDEDNRKNSEDCVMHRHSIKKENRPAWPK
jgi:hypothetical protein